MSYTIENYKKSKIPKTANSQRTICIPNEEYKKVLHSKIPYLENSLEKNKKINVSYAFEKGKNCALNAIQHISFNHTLSLDIKDFFDSIKHRHVKKYINKNVIDICFIEGAPAQGLPTSPIISNIAFIDIDEKIYYQIKKICNDFAYTRYADDMFFSFNSLRDHYKIKHIVEQILESEGFKLNDKKTTLQSKKGGRRIITGISVSETGIHPTRKTKRKIRAALHQKNKQSFQGLAEWAKCKVPIKN